MPPELLEVRVLKVAIGVMSHPDREGWVRRLIDQQVADVVVTDHEGWGENVTGNLTWRLLSKTEAEWAIVLQDDALPIVDFREHASAALRLVPADVGVVSFYTGTSRPMRIQAGLQEAIALADKEHASWLYYSYLLWGVAVAIRVVDLPDYLQWSDKRDDLLYDDRIGKWSAMRGKRVYYTHPSLVDHRDGPSLLNAHAVSLPRRAHRFGPPPRQWATPAIRIPEFPTRA